MSCRSSNARQSMLYSFSSQSHFFDSIICLLHSRCAVSSGTFLPFLSHSPLSAVIVLHLKQISAADDASMEIVLELSGSSYTVPFGLPLAVSNV